MASMFVRDTISEYRAWRKAYPISPAAFIAIARQRLPGRDFRVSEMEALPHADASFDVVTGFNAFQYAWIAPVSWPSLASL